MSPTAGEVCPRTREAAEVVPAYLSAVSEHPLDHTCMLFAFVNNFVLSAILCTGSRRDCF